ncbi:MAG: enolase C-terminal domain-like protein, partial [Candidatus Gracilibacteria bacterium]
IKNRLNGGFKIIKLKCGLDIEEDISRIKTAQKIIPETHKIVLDANQGYSLTNAEKLLSKLANTHVDIIEQPIDAKDMENLKHLHKTSKIPIVADESVVSPRDACNILLNDYAAGVNIKLMKCGGPINFLQIFLLAKNLNKIMMIGCMYESNTSITMGTNLALGLPLDYVDLDSGHLDFPDDPAIGGAQVHNGKITLNKPLDLNLGNI